MSVGYLLDLNQIVTVTSTAAGASATIDTKTANPVGDKVALFAEVYAGEDVTGGTVTLKVETSADNSTFTTLYEGPPIR